MIISSVGAEFFHVGRQTDMTKLIVIFCNFAYVPKKHENYNKYRVKREKPTRCN